MRRLTHFIVLTAFMMSCGGQWYLLQGIAWVKMIHDYSQIVPFTEAVSMTVSGKYPCEICRAIQEKKQAENDKLCSLEKFEKKFFAPAMAPLAEPQSAPVFYAVRAESLRFCTEPPPTPPPRSLLA